MAQEAFTEELLAWYAKGHRDLPWRATRDAYRIWISEIMLQQTRAETVVSYYERFLRAFPTVKALADAPEQVVLKNWEGLGYYSRARNLQAAARVICDQYGGTLPRTAGELITLPGIGAYTAGAVSAIAYGEREAAVDGNVERVIARYFGIREDITRPQVKRALRERAQEVLPGEKGDAQRAFANAMMELGATVCTPGKAACLLCPVRARCNAFLAGDVQELPVKQKKKAQRVERRGIAILLCEGCVLVRKREERLLNGLYVFPDFLDVTDPAGMADALWAQLGVRAVYDEPMGEARHVFTHIIWEMTLHAFVVTERVQVEGALWVDAKTLATLPMPTAVKAARRAALKRLREV